jgi:hypothetical protein
MEAALDLESSAFGLGGSTPPAPTKDVHVRQIRLAAAVRKTVAPSGIGGSNPSTCTRLSVS